MAETTTDVVIDISGAEVSATDYTLDVSMHAEADGEPRAMRVYVTQVYGATA